MGLFDRLRKRQDPTAPARQVAQEPAVELSPGELAEHESALRGSARVTFATTLMPMVQHDDLATDAAAEGLPLERAREILREEWDRRVQLAQEHRDDDDSGAVRRAFVALNAEGVLAVEALGYDNDEGHELATEEAGDVGAEGYVFFHAQDVERVVDGPGTLHLRYAAARYTATSAADKYAEDEAVGRRVVAALEGEGLAPTWDGSGASTITLERLRWYPVPGDA